MDTDLALAERLTGEGDLAAAAAVLRRAAATGDKAAKAALGRHLLSQPPFGLVEGMKLIRESADAGDADANHVAAIYTAFGFGPPQSWTGALDRSLRAAELGHGLAQAELAALANEWTLAMDLLAGESRPAQSWARLRAAIDLKAWLSPPPMGIASRSPRIGVVQGFISASVCDWLIARARPMLKRAMTFDAATAKEVALDGRTNRDCHFGMVNSDLVLCLVQARMSVSAELPMSAWEAPTILHYTVGQEFGPHYDFLDPEFPGYAMQTAEAGQRVLTFLVCLNDNYEGGETAFPVLGTRFKGSRGDGLFFWNVEPDGRIDKRTLHAGQPPTSGEKWLLSQWGRSRPVAT